MAVLTEENFFSAVQTLVGDRTDDDILSTMENIVDSYNDLKTKVDSPDDWKKKYDELDRAWRIKYRHRFYGSSPSNQTVGNGFPFDPAVPEKEEQEESVTPENISYDDLFEAKEAKK